jgi:hypothetical protein
MMEVCPHEPSYGIGKARGLRRAPEATVSTAQRLPHAQSSPQKISLPCAYFAFSENSLHSPAVKVSSLTPEHRVQNMIRRSSGLGGEAHWHCGVLQQVPPQSHDPTWLRPSR